MTIKECMHIGDLFQIYSHLSEDNKVFNSVFRQLYIDLYSYYNPAIAYTSRLVLIASVIYSLFLNILIAIN